MASPTPSTEYKVLIASANPLFRKGLEKMVLGRYGESTVLRATTATHETPHAGHAGFTSGQRRGGCLRPAHLDPCAGSGLAEQPAISPEPPSFGYPTRQEEILYEALFFCRGIGLDLDHPG